jgi:hypothetical protein
MSPVELYLVEAAESQDTRRRRLAWGLLAVLAFCLAVWILILAVIIELV